VLKATKIMNAKDFHRIQIILFFLMLTTFVNAQEAPDGKRRYRVTAFKASDLMVTSLSNTADAFPKSTLYIPSAFTPDGDGINDAFGVKGKNIVSLKMKIYNRWGELVYETQKLNDTWDGTYNGSPINNTDVFVYKVNAVSVDGKNLPEENGTVTLVADGTIE
jgi:gliding motility-associated-like protein